MVDQKIYHAPGLDLQKLGQDLAQWFQVKGFETQLLQGPGEAVTVQARKAGSWASISGTSAALNVMMTPQGDNLLVQTGGAKWVDKAAVGVVSLLIFWPLIALPAYGAYKQKELIDEAYQFLDSYIGSGGIPMAAPVAAPAAVSAPKAQARCPSCNQPVRAGAKFCDNCGASLVLACAQCGAELRPGAKFCDSCGAPAETRA